MNKKEKLALFLGMLSGDGCLSIHHNGEGYREYRISFCNTNKNLVCLFNDLFFELFNVRGNITSRKRAENRKEIWQFQKYSHKIVDRLKSLGFPEGVKRDVLRVLPAIFEGTKKEKLAFIYGVIITDGCIKKGNRGIMFHSGSKLFMNDMALLLEEIIGNLKTVKEYTQREIYKSYQLYLNKQERMIVLGQSPRGTMVLRWS